MSRPLSLATNASVELGGYQAAMEEVLTWLLEAEDRLSHHHSLSNASLDTIKEHFHSHEVYNYIIIIIMTFSKPPFFDLKTVEYLQVRV